MSAQPAASEHMSAPQSHRAEQFGSYSCVHHHGLVWPVTPGPSVYSSGVCCSQFAAAAQCRCLLQPVCGMPIKPLKRQAADSYYYTHSAAILQKTRLPAGRRHCSSHHWWYRFALEGANSASSLQTGGRTTMCQCVAITDRARACRQRDRLAQHRRHAKALHPHRHAVNHATCHTLRCVPSRVCLCPVQSVLA